MWIWKFKWCYSICVPSVTHWSSTSTLCRQGFSFLVSSSSWQGWGIAQPWILWLWHSNWCWSIQGVLLTHCSSAWPGNKAQIYCCHLCWGFFVGPFTARTCRDCNLVGCGLETSIDLNYSCCLVTWWWSILTRWNVKKWHQLHVPGACNLNIMPSICVPFCMALVKHINTL
jgi:hypothetical protein